MNEVLDNNKMKELGFHVQDGVNGKEFVYKVEGASTEIVCSAYPLNSFCFFIRLPDNSLVQFTPDTIDEIKVMQRVFARGYCENPYEAWFPGDECEN